MKYIASLATFVFVSLPFAAFAQVATVTPPSNAIIPGQQSSAAIVQPQAPQTSGGALEEITTLQQELAQLQTQLGGSATQTTTNAGTSLACGAIVPVLSVGSTGTGVSQLQTFLAQSPSIYPQGLVTGYYGALTEAAVQAFQTQNNIVSSGSLSTTGYGQVGPKTASTVQAQCGGSGTSAAGPTATQFGGFIQVSPTSGDTPLYENVQATVNTTNDCGSSIYTLDWGDGTPSQAIQVPAGTCASEQQTYTHTYTTAGTYSITLAAGTHSSSATVVAQ